MIDKEKLRYDLAMQSAAVMTLSRNVGNPPDMMLINFLVAYRRYGENLLDEELNKAVEEINKSE